MTRDAEAGAVPEPGEPPTSARQEFVRVLVLLAVGAGLLFLAYGRTWVTAVYGGTGVPTITIELTGRDLQPVGAALPVVALAGIAGLVATRGVGRRVAGALLVLAGLAATGLAVRSGLTWSDASGDGATVDRLVGEKVGLTVAHVPASATSWWIVAAVGGLLVAVGGGLALARGARWPALGRRYERPGAPQESTAPQSRAESAWDLLDRGVDPTADGLAGGSDPMLGNGPPA